MGRPSTFLFFGSAMVHGIAAPGLAARPYFHRYTEDAIDLRDVLYLIQFAGEGDAARTVSDDGAAGRTRWNCSGRRLRGITATVTSGKSLSTVKATFLILIARVAAPRALSRAVVRCRISGERG